MRAGLNISIKCRLISTDTSAKLISDSYVVEVTNARPPFPFPPHSGHRMVPMCRRQWTAFGCIVFTVALTPTRPWRIRKTVGICSVDPMLNSTPARKSKTRLCSYGDNLVTKLLWSQGGPCQGRRTGDMDTERRGSILRTCRLKCQCQCEGRYRACYHPILQKQTRQASHVDQDRIATAAAATRSHIHMTSA